MQKIKIVGILNITSDSFYDGGKFIDADKAVNHAKQLILEGANILDIGAESSRPGAIALSITEELQRLLPVISKIKEFINQNNLDVQISIDTYKPEVAEKCLQLGVHIINDITGLQNDVMGQIIAKYKAGVIIMHMQGNPQTMQVNPKYEDVVGEIKEFFAERIAKAQKFGISNIILDPGIGFGKTVEHNMAILRDLRAFLSLGYPLLIGVSRKSFIGKLTEAEVSDRLPGTIAMNVMAVMQGVSYLRVHDVKEHKQVVQMFDAFIGRK